MGEFEIKRENKEMVKRNFLPNFDYSDPSKDI